jgi:site-specific recombinase XerD
MHLEHLDLQSAVRTAALIGMKGRPSRRIPLGDRDVLALKRWLNHRARHRRIRSADQGPLWIADKTGATLKGDGTYQMLRRRAVEAGTRPRQCGRTCSGTPWLRRWRPAGRKPRSWP